MKTWIIKKWWKKENTRSLKAQINYGRDSPTVVLMFILLAVNIYILIDFNSVENNSLKESDYNN